MSDGTDDENGSLANDLLTALNLESESRPGNVPAVAVVAMVVYSNGEQAGVLFSSAYEPDAGTPTFTAALASLCDDVCSYIDGRRDAFAVDAGLLHGPVVVGLHRPKGKA